jgi:hypothetical protein
MILIIDKSANQNQNQNPGTYKKDKLLSLLKQPVILCLTNSNLSFLLLITYSIGIREITAD